MELGFVSERQYRLTLAIIIGIICMYVGGCGILREIQHSKHRGRIMSGSAVVEEYYAHHEKLPGSFKEAFDEFGRLKKAKHLQVMHYRQVGEQEYILWLRSREISSGFEEHDYRGDDEMPEEGDVVGHFSIGGKLIESTWGVRE
jgi:hypothetical protein